jgi:hypothetical protein
MASGNNIYFAAPSQMKKQYPVFYKDASGSQAGRANHYEVQFYYD